MSTLTFSPAPYKTFEPIMFVRREDGEDIAAITNGEFNTYVAITPGEAREIADYMERTEP